MERLKVFLSGTQTDMKPERDAVDQALSPFVEIIRAESQSSKAYSSREEVLRYASECDIYLGLYGYRYGAIIQPENISVTELEFKKARELRKLMLIYVKKEGQGEKRQPRQAAFIKRVSNFEEGLFRRPGFTSPDELANWVVQDVSELVARWLHQSLVRPAPFMAPRPIDYFVGREPQLEQLYQPLKLAMAPVIFAIHGVSLRPIMSHGFHP